MQEAVKSVKAPRKRGTRAIKRTNTQIDVISRVDDQRGDKAIWCNIELYTSDHEPIGASAAPQTLMSRSQKLLRLPLIPLHAQPCEIKLFEPGIRGSDHSRQYVALLRLSTHHTLFSAQSLRGRAGCSPRESLRIIETSACDYGH